MCRENLELKTSKLMSWKILVKQSAEQCNHPQAEVVSVFGSDVG